MKYVIMADGKGTRWNNHNNIPKHFIEIDGERLIDRCVRLIHEYDSECQVIVTSHDPRYDLEGATRYEPLNNILEIDRFTEELIEDDVCFMYGDTYYSEQAMETIVKEPVKDLMFFGNRKSIIAVKVHDGEYFRKLKGTVRDMFVKGEAKTCKGWQVYQLYIGGPLDEKQPGRNYILIGDDSRDFNAPEDLK